MDRQALQTHLGLMVDADGLGRIIEALEQVCYEKAQHLEENWQDKTAAKEWDKAGTLLGKLWANKAFPAL